MTFVEKKNFLWNLAYFIAVTGLVYLLFRFLLVYLFPFVIGGVLALLMRRPAEYLAKKTGGSRGVWAAALVTVVYLTAAVLFALLIRRLTLGLGTIAEQIPQTIARLNSAFDRTEQLWSTLLSRLPDNAAQTVRSMRSDTLDRISGSATSFLTDTASAIVSGVPGFLLSAVVTVVASCYLARDTEHLLRFAREILPPRTVCTAKKIKKILTGSVGKMLIGYLILMAITFTELMIGFLILRIDHAVPIALLTAVVDLLPVLGTGTVLLPWGLICFALGNTGRGLGLCVLYLLIIVVRNFTEPRIIGHQIGISPLLTLLSMFVGLRLAGAAGLLLFPITCIVTVNYYREELAEERAGRTKPDARA